MSDAYTILGLPPGADEAAIRRRYLELVREYPPERCPDQFARIRAAYDHLRDPETRLYQQLFQPRVGESLDEIIADVQRNVPAARIPTEVLLSIAEG
jgi:curved DNA-binding protein CbpA